MSYRNKICVVFDADNDLWAYLFMRGWKENDNINFNFNDAHDINRVTSFARSVAYIKSKLKERFKTTKQVIVIIAERRSIYINMFVGNLK